MNHKNIRALRAHLSTLGNKAKAVAVGGAAALAAPAAFAQSTGGFDPTPPSQRWRPWWRRRCCFTPPMQWASGP